MEQNEMKRNGMKRNEKKSVKVVILVGGAVKKVKINRR